MNKSYITNAIALITAVGGYFLENEIIFSIGLFAVSGAITNSIAIHMLFEKVPGLYGSGVIPARFEEFKLGIRDLMMTQFFTDENIDKFLSDSSGAASHLNLVPIIEKIDLEPAFNSLVNTIEESSFGSMLAMFGGSEALIPLKEPFIIKMKTSFVEITQSDNFNELVKAELEQPDVLGSVKEKVESIITKRLDELTPQLVKQIIQDMIRKHLGWLVVWGGVFGGLIGLISALLQL
ncbi:DUF445 domain-containing protein [Thalassomonas sp. M1454]|uniref:DUF445 domain-containing protein n=1 Tax=Thalassomonas sp. M1454 TaxID=2594477 RepID=UPI001180B724|nr:DUF445 domain-containing protein [Thalassomonas sp. M1454]TRX55107.1 DUF445 domain-containing protein [Thalassomonas sp. M1454]